MDRNVTQSAISPYVGLQRAPSKFYNYKQIQRDSLDPKNIVYVFVYGTPHAYNDSVQSENPSLPTGLSNMLDEFKQAHIGFCKKERAIHSFWVKVDQDKKEVILYTFTDNLNYDLERKIFDGPYSGLPPTFNGFYLDLRVDPLEVPDNIYENFELVYMRESQDAQP